MSSSQSRIWRLLLLVFYWLVLVATCPERCTCKWKNGKQNVECIGKNYNYIPRNVDPGSQVFDFSENSLMMLQNNTFESLGLINLQKIYLVKCKINKISDQAFHGLKNLVDLDLSQNLLTHIPTPIFEDCPSLMRLSLNENPIRNVQKNAFRHLSFLTTLELSSSEISSIEDEAFVGLNNLEWLKLDNNKLATIKGANVLPETLHGVDLHNNKWQCDCHLRDLYSWISTYNIPHLTEPICHAPKRLNGKPIKSLSEVDLACLLDVLPSKLYVEVNDGQNISLQCIVNAIPEANISWWFQGQNLQSDWIDAQKIQTYRIEEEGSSKKRSELFISNINVSDNGTYECVGENPAGRSQANYTIKVMMKEEPVVIEVEFPFEYVVALLACGGAIVIILLIVILVAIIKCTKKTRKNGKKRVNVELENNPKATFASCLSVAPSKIDGSTISNDTSHSVLFCQINPNREFMVNNVDNHFYIRSDAPAIYNHENNPDIINHADSKDCQKDDCANFAVTPMQLLPTMQQRQVKWIDQQNYIDGTPPYIQESQIAIDFQSKSFHDLDGYPLDYGLPKIETVQRSLVMPKSNSVFYRTLPHKSTLKKAALSRNGFSHEAEMYSGPKQPQGYNVHNPLEKRYTMEGYPFVQSKRQIPSVDFITSEAMNSSPVNYRCSESSGEFKKYSGQCVNCVAIESNKDPMNHSTCAQVSTRCVPTQTEPDIDLKEKGEDTLYGKIKRVGTSTESADEGYVGDGLEIKDS